MFRKQLSKAILSAAENLPALQKISSVYDTRTIAAAKWTFRHFITFVEFVSYGK